MLRSGCRSGIGQVSVWYWSIVGRFWVFWKLFSVLWRVFLFFRKQNKTLKRGQTFRVLTFTFEVWGFRSFDENSGTFPSRVVLLVLPGTSKTQNQHISTLKKCSKFKPEVFIVVNSRGNHQPLHECYPYSEYVLLTNYDYAE